MEDYIEAIRYLDETRQLFLGRQRAPESIADRIKYRRSSPMADWLDQFKPMGTPDQESEQQLDIE